MSSLNAEGVAHEVLFEVGKGRKASLRKIIPKHGYSLSVADSPKKVTKTKAYQRVISPVVDQLEKERQAIIARLPKVRSKAKYRDLMDGLDKTSKYIQLLTGGATENHAIIVSSEERESINKLFDEN